MTQFLSGHGNFGSYLKRFNISVSDLCECERSRETPQHIIFDCDIYYNKRHQLISESLRLGHSWPTPSKTLVENKTLFLELIMFIKNIYNV